MKTITVCTTSYVEVADDATETDAEEIVAGALETVDSIYLVKVQREATLVEA